MRLDWLEPTLSEGGTTVGRAWAVTIELVELCGDYNVTILSFQALCKLSSLLLLLRYLTRSSSVNLIVAMCPI